MISVELLRSSAHHYIQQTLTEIQIRISMLALILSIKLAYVYMNR
jgi:hypothetical protein